MMLIYVAHKMSENIAENTERVKRLLKYFIKTDPNNTYIAPYLTSFEVLDDTKPSERSKGLQDALNVVKRCDLLLVCSDVSAGIEKEIETASRNQVKIQFWSE